MRVPRRWIICALVPYWLLIFVGTHLPAARVPGIEVSDKLAHFGAFFGLTLLLVSEMALWFREGKGDWLALLIVAIYGAIDEWSQRFAEGRSTDIADWMADMSGAACAIAAWGLIRWFVYRRRSKNIDAK